jgi:hypothetical protein
VDLWINRLAQLQVLKNNVLAGCMGRVDVEYEVSALLINLVIQRNL